MRLIAYLVLAASLVAGVVGAVTAYLPRIDAADAPQHLAGLRLNAPAGRRALDAPTTTPTTTPATATTTAPTTAPAGPQPMVPDGAVLTESDLRDLQAAGVRRVTVREFSPARWTGWWLFALGCLGLLAAGVYLRRASARALAESDAAGAAAGRADPAATLAALRADVAALLGDVGVAPAAPATAFGTAPGASPRQATSAADPAYGELAYAAPHVRTPAAGKLPACERIMADVGEMQKTHMPAFIDARPRLVAAFGMAGYARLMDAYAAAERQLNRAWTAAADNAEPEAVAALERALALLDESAARLPGR